MAYTIASLLLIPGEQEELQHFPFHHLSIDPLCITLALYHPSIAGTPDFHLPVPTTIVLSLPVNRHNYLVLSSPHLSNMQFMHPVVIIDHPRL